MKNTVVKQFAIIIQWLVRTLVLCSLFYVNPILATDSIYGETLPKVTSSKDCLPPINYAAISPIATGAWADPSIWPGGNLPTENDDITVPPGITLIMVGNCRAKSITVRGLLTAINYQPNGAWVDLRTESIVVANNGIFEIGTEEQPYIADKNSEGIRCQITLTGAKISNPPSYHKGILVENGGKLELHGKRKKSWTNIAATVNPGDTQITLREAVDWEVGDIVALTATGLATGFSKEWEKVDQVEILEIGNNGRTLTTTPLQYKHIGGSRSYTNANGKTWNVDVYGEIGLLSHYIKIQGETSDADGFGGHIMIMKGATSHSENIELYRMGQKAIQGRYPYHWHLNENQSMGSYLRNSSIHKSFNRAVTIHGTDYVTVDGVFAYDHIGHGLFLEDGGERFNNIRNNVVFVTRRPKADEALTPSENFKQEQQNRAPASYWITNPNNYFENNVAAGTEGTGFWLALPHNGNPGDGKVMGDSGELTYYENLDPISEPLGRFDGFVAHTCRQGWDIFDQLAPDHSLTPNGGWSVTTDQFFNKGLFYGNEIALYCGLGNQAKGDNRSVVFSNCMFTDNETVSMLAGNLTISNTLFNADSGLGVFDGPRNFYLYYDGPGRHLDCHFEGWDQSNANIIKQTEGGGAQEKFNPIFRGTTVSASIPFKFYPLPNSDNTRARKVGQFLKDYDGGLTGKAHTTIVRDIPFLTDGHEYKDPSWQNAVRSDYYFGSLWMEGSGFNQNQAKISAVRTKPGTDDVCFYDSGPGTGTYKFPIIANEGFLYNFYFDRVPKGDKDEIAIRWGRADPGDIGYACFRGLGKLGNVRVDGSQFDMPRLNSKTEIDNADFTAYYVDEDDVYVKFRFVSENPAKHVLMYLVWENEGSFQPADLPCRTNDLSPRNEKDNDGDGRPDIVENQTCGDMNNASDLNFGFKGNDNQFTVENIGATTVEDNDFLVLQVNSQGPRIKRGGLEFNGSQVPQLRIRARSESAGRYVLYWTTTNTDNFNGDHVAVFNRPPSNDFQEITFDLSNNNRWIGQTITQIRIDIPGSEAAATRTWIDYIRGPNAQDCTGASATTIVHIRKANALDYALDGGNDNNPDDNVILWEGSSDNANQQWIEIDRGNGYYSYQKLNTGLCIDGGNGGANGQNLLLWECGENNPNQHWLKVPVENNIYRLEKREAGGYSIDGDFGGENGRPVYLWDSNHGNPNQHWVFEVVGTSGDKNKEPNANDLISFYPNPVTNTLFISANTENKFIEVYDILGAVKISKELGEGENSIDFSGLSSGYYIAKVKNMDNSGKPDQIIKILKN